MAQKPELKLTWIGKGNRPKLELLIGKLGRLRFSEETDDRANNHVSELQGGD